MLKTTFSNNFSSTGGSSVVSHDGTLNGDGSLASPLSVNFWKEPVNDIASLPLIDNRIGDVRLVLLTRTLYSWDGAVWIKYNTPSSLTNYLGNWNASTNTPAITSGVGSNGDWYNVSVAGATNIDGISSWGVGDYIWFSSSTNTWQKINNQVGGSTAPAGLNGQIQFNNSGNFGADTGLNYNSTTKRMAVNRATASAPLHVEATASVVATREVIQRWTVSDDGGAYLDIRNGLASTSANRYNPAILGFATNITDPCLTLLGEVPAQTGTTPAILLKAFYSLGGVDNALTSRDILAINNANTRYFTLNASGDLGIGIAPLSKIHSSAKVRADTGFNFNGTDGATDTASGIITDIDIQGGIITSATKTTPVADGTYTVGIGGTQNGTITITNGIITAIQQAI